METLYKKIDSISIDGEHFLYLIKIKNKKITGLYKDDTDVAIYNNMDISCPLSLLEDADSNEYEKMAFDIKSKFYKIIEDTKNDKNFVVLNDNILEVYEDCDYNKMYYIYKSDNDIIIGHDTHLYEFMEKDQIKKFYKKIKKILSNFDDIKNIHDEKYKYYACRCNDDAYLIRCYYIDNKKYKDLISLSLHKYMYIEYKTADIDNIMEKGTECKETDFKHDCKNVFKCIKGIMDSNYKYSCFEYLDDDSIIIYMQNKINDHLTINLSNNSIHILQEHNDTDNKSKKVSKFIKKLSKLADDI